MLRAVDVNLFFKVDCAVAVVLEDKLVELGHTWLIVIKTVAAGEGE